jgi:tRNA dimethylallyltransferase
MDPNVFQDALILTGPTAAGKSAVGMVLAERLAAEIVSMDSMALYRGMDIGTAKPGQAERDRLPHHLIDVLDPWQSASLAWWLEQAGKACDDIVRRGRRPLFVGGTPLYVKALLHGIFEGPPARPGLRQSLERLGGQELHARLRRLDPQTAGRLHPNDIRRLVRALEVIELTGKPLSAWQQEFKTQPSHRVPAVWLDLPRDVLYKRINDRLERMMAGGLLDEVKRLIALPRPLSREARQALGYKELLDHLEGKVSLAEAVSRVKTRSRNLAKRQLTWFRHLPACRRLPIQSDETAEEIAERIMANWPATPAGAGGAGY